MTIDQLAEEPNLSIYFSSTAGTHVGMRREENQDSLLILTDDQLHCYVVADGMGGAQGGAVASSLALEVFQESIQQASEINEQAITSAIQAANGKIFDAGSNDPALLGMGTTFVGFVCLGTKMFLFNVGDSRVYRIRQGMITALTEDHTLVMDLIRSGAITADQAENHPVSHMLTRSLGPADQVEPDSWLCEDGPAQGDRYIVCSDGLYNMVSDREMLRMVSENSLEDARDACIQLANENGGTDNITVILMEVGENFPVSPDEFAPLVSEDEDTVELIIDEEGVVSEASGERVVSSNGRGQMQEAEEPSSLDLSPVIEENIPLDDIQDIEHTAKGVEEGETDSIEPASSDEEISDEIVEEEQEFQAAEEAEAVEDEAVEDIEELPEAPDEIDQEEEEEVEEAAEPEADVSVELDEDLLEAAEAADEEEAELERPAKERSRAVTTLLVFSFGVAFTIAAGFFVNYFRGPQTLTGSAATHPDIVRRLDEIDGSNQAGTEKAVQDLQETQASAATKIDAGETAVAGHLTAEEVFPERASTINGLPYRQAQEISNRKRMVRGRIQSLETKVGSFDQPLSGNLGELHRTATRELEVQRAQLDDVRAQIDVATRRVAVWYGRRKRLQTTDHINLAGEVSVSSPEVRDAKVTFEEATWNYLKQAENLRYDPANTDLKKEVENLTRVRKVKMKELRSTVATAIEKEAEAAHKHITELTLARDSTELRIRDLEDDLKYLKILTGGAKSERLKLEQELEGQLGLARSELEELDQILPTNLELSASKSSE